MKKTAILNTDDMMSLFLLSQLNEDILRDGLTKDNREALTDLQECLLFVVRKFQK